LKAGEYVEKWPALVFFVFSIMLLSTICNSFWMSN
jgi:hypothetical protein